VPMSCFVCLMRPTGRGFEEVGTSFSPEYHTDVTPDSDALVFRAYTCTWPLLPSESFKGVSRRIWLTSVQYSSDSVQFCNPRCFLTLQSTVIAFCNVTRLCSSLVHSATVFRMIVTYNRGYLFVMESQCLSCEV
jgi:hypothetical protein